MPIDSCPVCDAPITQPAAQGRRRVYCSNRCKQAAKRERQNSCAPLAEDVLAGAEPVEAFLVGRSAPVDDQVLAAVHETILLVITFRRLGTEARRQFAWRCGGMADALAAALDRYFKAPS